MSLNRVPAHEFDSDGTFPDGMLPHDAYVRDAIRFRIRLQVQDRRGCAMTGSEAIPNPFAPGTGAYPPVLAGRDAEQAVLLDSLLRIAHPTRGGPANMLLLSAPRGMGKTVLLDWLREQAESRGIAVTNLVASGIPDLPALGGALWPEGTSEPAKLVGVQAGPSGRAVATGANGSGGQPPAKQSHRPFACGHRRPSLARSGRRSTYPGPAGRQRAVQSRSAPCTSEEAGLAGSGRHPRMPENRLQFPNRRI